MVTRITQDGIEVDQKVRLANSPTNTEVPYSYSGVNTNSVAYTLYPSPACGCTTSQKQFKVGPGEAFKIEGVFKGSAGRISYSKNITLYYGEGDNYDITKKIALSFSGQIV
jgi:hypothetical protein